MNNATKRSLDTSHFILQTIPLLFTSESRSLSKLNKISINLIDEEKKASIYKSIQVKDQ